MVAEVGIPSVGARGFSSRGRDRPRLVGGTRPLLLFGSRPARGYRRCAARQRPGILPGSAVAGRPGCPEHDQKGG